MSDNKTKDIKKSDLGSTTNSEKSVVSKSMTSNSQLKQAKIVSISQASEKRKLELINQIIKTTPSF